MSTHRLAMTRYLCLLLSLVLLPACASEQRLSDASMREYLPKACYHWSVDVLAPRYMEAWVEDLEVKDDRGHWIQIPMGVVGAQGGPAGWPPASSIAGYGTIFKDTGNPVEIFIRWQSLAEPQTYTWKITLPPSMREAMAKKEPVTWYDKPDLACRSGITLGIAPGGRTIMWIGSLSLPAIEVMRGQAEVEPLGPYEGKSNGKYRPMHEPARKYVDEHGIPYGSWDH